MKLLSIMPLASFFFLLFFFLHRFYSFLLKKFSEQSEFQKHIYLIITELTVWHILPFGSQWTQLLGDKLYLDTIYYEYLYNFMVWSCLVFSNKKYWKSASPVFTWIEPSITQRRQISIVRFQNFTNLITSWLEFSQSIHHCPSFGCIQHC